MCMGSSVVNGNVHRQCRGLTLISNLRLMVNTPFYGWAATNTNKGKIMVAAMGTPIGHRCCLPRPDGGVAFRSSARQWLVFFSHTTVEGEHLSRFFREHHSTALLRKHPQGRNQAQMQGYFAP